MKVIFASQNKGKQKEAKELFKELGITLLFPSNFPELREFDVDESGETFAQNATLKAKAYAHKVNLPAIADDSGIIINDFGNNFPGVYSNRWFEGTADDKNKEVLKRLAENKDSKRLARYTTAVCFYDPKSNKKYVFEADLKGSIGYKIVGDQGFAYDRIFIPSGYNQTLAQLGNEVKNKMSQRAKAYNKLKKILQENDDE